MTLFNDVIDYTSMSCKHFLVIVQCAGWYGKGTVDRAGTGAKGNPNLPVVLRRQESTGWCRANRSMTAACWSGVSVVSVNALGSTQQVFKLQYSSVSLSGGSRFLLLYS